MHSSIELLSQLFSEAMLSTLLRSSSHTKPFSGNSERETFPKIPSQAWACLPVFLGSQTYLFFPSYPQASLTAAFQEGNYRNMSWRGVVMRKTTVAAQAVIVNTCIAGSVAQLCHLGLSRHFLDAFICQSVEDKVRNSWGDWGIHSWPGGFKLQLRNNAKQKKGKGQLLDQLICLATLSGDMTMWFIEDGKVHFWVSKDSRKDSLK